MKTSDKAHYKYLPVTVTAAEFDYALKLIASTTTFAKSLSDENPIKAEFFLKVIRQRIDANKGLATHTQIKLMYLIENLVHSSKHIDAMMEAREELIINEMENKKDDLEGRWDARRKLGRIYRELEKDLGHFRMRLFRECVGDAIYSMSAKADKRYWLLIKDPNLIVVTFIPANPKNRRPHASNPFELRIAGLRGVEFGKAEEDIYIYKFPNFQTCPTLMS